MRAGNLRYLIDIFRKETTRDEYNASVITWNFCKQLKADVKLTVGNKAEDEDEVFSTKLLQIWIRNTTDITVIDRIKYNDEMYLIEFIQPDRTKRWSQLICSRLNE